MSNIFYVFLTSFRPTTHGHSVTVLTCTPLCRKAYITITTTTRYDVTTATTKNCHVHFTIAKADEKCCNHRHCDQITLAIY